ncbi:MAG: HU family DNA-binding protein [Micromonosporaceae bacterium]|nr:HU family DNA-binding protein [Micromonosporaceae bacterium]
MNKSELIERVTGRLGDQKASSIAVDALVTEIQNAVTMGDKVNISGFGVFEKRDRAPRVGRNPRTGEPIEVQQTSVPVFRPGQTFKTLVASGKTPRGAQAQTSRSQAGRAQPARSSRTQTTRAQTSSRAQSSRAQSSRAQSSYARSRGAQSSYARQGASQRQSARARTR